MTTLSRIHPPRRNTRNAAAATLAVVALEIAGITGWAWPLALGLWLGQRAGAFKVGRG